MNVPEFVLLFALYTIVVIAGVAIVMYFRGRRPRTKPTGLPIPNVAGLNVRPMRDRNLVAWPPSEGNGTTAPLPARQRELEPVNVTPAAPPPLAAHAETPASEGRQPARNGRALALAESDDATIVAASNGARRSTLAAATATVAATTAPKATALAIDEAPQEIAPASPLARVFLPNNPSLPEGLRTLEVTPNRIIEPGALVHATFTFRNPGGGAATGFRVRFRQPEGLTYVPGSAKIDDIALGEQEGRTLLFQPSGADIGDVPPGGERRVSLAFSVAPAIENGTAVSLQAAIASADIPVIGSNIVRLVVRSVPQLQNAQTTLTIAPVRQAIPGQELQLTARIHNSGQSSAHDIVVLLPLPAHTTFSPNSVSVNGRAFTGSSESIPFGFARPTVVAKVLAPGATLDVGYRVRINTPLEDATPITATGSVCSEEVGEFALPPAGIEIPSTASFDGFDTLLRVECKDDVQPGERVRVVLHAKNVGTAAARRLGLRISLPHGMVYAAGSLTIDGALAPDRGSIPDSVPLGDLEPGRSVELSLLGIVQSPIDDGHQLKVRGDVVWSKGERTFERVLTARSAPRFPLDFNKIERDTSRRVGPGDAISYTIVLQNMGTDVATDVRLQLNADGGLEFLRVLDRYSDIAVDGGAIPLDPLEPGVSRTLRVDGQIASIIEDQTPIRLHATILTAQLTPIKLATRVDVVESRPKFSVKTSRIIADNTDAPLRFKRVSSCRLVLTNEGTDCGRDVRVSLVLPDELRLEGVDNARREGGNAVVFGDIPAGETREAVLYLRLVGIVPGGDLLPFSARIGGLNVVPLGLGPIELATYAEASFAQNATLTSSPDDAIDAGGQIEYTLALRNSGDGAAKHLTVRLATLTNAVYAQGSTTVNGIALQDHSGTSLLLSLAGLRLADVGAGVDVIIRWNAIVNMPLPPSTPIECSAALQWDDASEIAIGAAPVSVRSSSALPVIDPELPFSVLGAIAAPAPRTALGRARPTNGNGKVPSVSGSGPAPTAIEAIEYTQLGSGNASAAKW